MSDLIPVILCGGSGSRLWPVSRETHPKPFIRLPDGESLLQKALLRALGLEGVREVLIVTNRELHFKIEDEFKALGRNDVTLSFILEPFGRNTAAAIAAAAYWIDAHHGASANMLVLAADHLIADQQGFCAAVTAALSIAQSGRLVTFGIQPEWPETGYGYIESNGNEVVRFVEKPDLETAKQYLASGEFLWNSGIFCFRADRILGEMSVLCPEILDGVKACMAHSRQTVVAKGHLVELDPGTFERVPDDSIDYAVMEKTDQAAVVGCDIGWSDIGSWTALGDLSTADVNGNRVTGEALLHDTHNTTVHSSNERIVGTVGIDDLVIIDTPDALLVADKDRAQDVKHLYGQLKSMGHDAHKHHRTVHRPWGTYTVLEEGPGFKIKRIEVKPKASLSLQMHQHRSEHWVVVQGNAMVVNGDTEIELQINESTFIPAGHQHRLMNQGPSPLVIIEVQTGHYLGEDDIVRLSDVYGRV